MLNVVSHGRQGAPGTFPRHEYSCSNCSDKVSNTKITKKHLFTAHFLGGFPTLMADTTLKKAVDRLFDQGSIVRC